MRKVELQRGDRDETIVDGFKIGIVSQRMLDPVQAEPVVSIPTWIRSRYHGTTRIVMKSLANHANPADFLT